MKTANFFLISLIVNQATTTFSGNMLACTGDNSVLLVDNCMEGATKVVQKELQKLSDKPIMYVISTKKL